MGYIIEAKVNSIEVIMEKKLETNEPYKILAAIGLANFETYKKQFSAYYEKEEKQAAFDATDYDNWVLFFIKASNYNDFDIMEHILSKILSKCKDNQHYDNPIKKVEDLIGIFKNKGKIHLDKMMNPTLMQPIIQLRGCLFDISSSSNKSQSEREALLRDISPNLKPTFRIEELEALDPFFNELRSLDQMAKSRSVKSKDVLNGFNDKVREELKSLIEEKKNPEENFRHIETLTNNVLDTFEKGDIEVCTALKNVLLLCSIVGPFIKRIQTGEWFFENSKIAAVRQAQRTLTRIITDDGMLLKPLFFNIADVTKKSIDDPISKPNI